MVELRVINTGDLHENYGLVRAIKEFVEERKDSEGSIDAWIDAGDYLESHNEGKGQALSQPLSEYWKRIRETTVNVILNNNISPEEFYGYDQDTQTRVWNESQKAAKPIVHQKLAPTIDIDTIIGLIDKGYTTMASELSEVDVPIYGTLGNHDWLNAYAIMSDENNGPVKFLDNCSPKKITGKTGIEFTIAGDTNTHECTTLADLLTSAMQSQGREDDIFVNYISGQSTTYVQSQIDKAEREGNTQAKTELQEFLKEVVEYQTSERTRLGDGDIDIYVSHKLPSCDKAEEINGAASSEVTVEYAANANAVFGGHFHDGQIGHYRLPDLLADLAGAETTIIDGVEVPILYIPEHQPWHVNPGENGFTVTEFGSDKQVEQVIVYEVN